MWPCDVTSHQTLRMIGQYFKLGFVYVFQLQYGNIIFMGD
jgi:hypothetical protein